MMKTHHRIIVVPLRGTLFLNNRGRVLDGGKESRPKFIPPNVFNEATVEENSKTHFLV
jgi:hypothetical protein